jgi:hypothetical protein
MRCGSTMQNWRFHLLGCVTTTLKHVKRVLAACLGQSSSVAVRQDVRTAPPTPPSYVQYCTCWQATSPACPACLHALHALPARLAVSIVPRKGDPAPPRVRSEDSGGWAGWESCASEVGGLTRTARWGQRSWDFHEVILQLSGSFRQSSKEISLLPGFLTS